MINRNFFKKHLEDFQAELGQITETDSIDERHIDNEDNELWEEDRIYMLRICDIILYFNSTNNWIWVTLDDEGEEYTSKGRII